MRLQNHARDSPTGALKWLIMAHGAVGRRGETFLAVWDNGTATDRSVNEEWPASRLKLKTE